MSNEVDFIALLKYNTPEEGGRSVPAFPHYRPQVKFPFSTMQTSGRQIFIDKEIVYPGEVVKAEIKIIATEFFQNRLEEGMNFDFREGHKIIGTGQIIKIVNETLKKSSTE